MLPPTKILDFISTYWSPLWLSNVPSLLLSLMQLLKMSSAKFTLALKMLAFFKDLVSFMTSGPVMVQVLEGENAVVTNRELMGATNPKNADKGTIRADFADSIDENAVHGSDSLENAAIEIAYFFGKDGDLCPRTR